MSKKSLILVVIQFTLLGYFALFTRFWASGFWLFVQFLALGVALWGIWAMKIGNFNIQPEVRSGAVFIRKGPYRYIRNPMYSGIIFFLGTMLADHPDRLNFLLYLILCIDLGLKIVFEERFLEERFGKKYLEYKSKTYRLIPFIL